MFGYFGAYCHVGRKARVDSRLSALPNDLQLGNPFHATHPWPDHYRGDPARDRSVWPGCSRASAGTGPKSAAPTAGLSWSIWSTRPIVSLRTRLSRGLRLRLYGRRGDLLWLSRGNPRPRSPLPGGGRCRYRFICDIPRRWSRLRFPSPCGCRFGFPIGVDRCRCCHRGRCRGYLCRGFPSEAKRLSQDRTALGISWSR